MRAATTRATVRQPLLTEREAAAVLRLTPRALQAWRLQGRGPQFVRISARAVRYRPEDVEGWIDAQLRSSTSDPGQPPERLNDA